jgi:regulator of protease activity HflC (stomatin/prohibitin superfamily)
MERIQVNVTTGERQVIQLTAEEIAQAQAQAEQAAQAEAQARIANAAQLRQQAYTSESDPLFFKWQAGESTEAEWKAKRDEIRSRFPKE